MPPTIHEAVAGWPYFVELQSRKEGWTEEIGSAKSLNDAVALAENKLLEALGPPPAKLPRDIPRNEEGYCYAYQLPDGGTMFGFTRDIGGRYKGYRSGDRKKRAPKPEDFRGFEWAAWSPRAQAIERLVLDSSELAKYRRPKTESFALPMSAVVDVAMHYIAAEGAPVKHSKNISTAQQVRALREINEIIDRYEEQEQPKPPTQTGDTTL